MPEKAAEKKSGIRPMAGLTRCERSPDRKRKMKAGGKRRMLVVRRRCGPDFVRVVVRGRMVGDFE
jgi:hypothetical protein